MWISKADFEELRINVNDKWKIAAMDVILNEAPDKDAVFMPCGVFMLNKTYDSIREHISKLEEDLAESEAKRDALSRRLGEYSEAPHNPVKRLESDLATANARIETLLNIIDNLIRDNKNSDVMPYTFEPVKPYGPGDQVVYLDGKYETTEALNISEEESHEH